MRGTFYLAQLTKYLPAGGIVQTASQVGLAPSAGVSIKRAAVAFPVSVVGAVVACGTLGSGLVFDSGAPGWTRALAAARPRNRRCSSIEGLMAWVIDLAHRFVARIPGSDQLPTQRDIVAFYLWALGHRRLALRRVRGSVGLARQQREPVSSSSVRSPSAGSSASSWSRFRPESGSVRRCCSSYCRGSAQHRCSPRRSPCGLLSIGAELLAWSREQGRDPAPSGPRRRRLSERRRRYRDAGELTPP